MQRKSTDSSSRPSPNRTEEMASLAEIAERLGLSEQNLHNWVASGDLRAYRDHDDVYLRPEEVLRFIQKRESMEDSTIHHEEPDSTASEEKPEEEKPLPTPDESLVTLEELSRFVAIPEKDLEGFLQEGILTRVEGPGGKGSVRRDEIARLLLSSAGRASILDAAGPAWPDAGEPAPLLWEGGPEELDEDATEETDVGSVESAPAPVKGAVTLRFYSKMNPRRSFPLLLQAARLSAPLRAVPRLPGCICVPTGLDLTLDHPQGEFWITPQAIGPVPKAAIELFVSGEKVAEIRTPVLVRSLTGAWILLALSAAFLALAPIMEILEKSLGKHSTFGSLVHLMGGPIAAGIILSALSFVGGALWFLWANPAENHPTTVSLSSAFPPQGQP